MGAAVNEEAWKERSAQLSKEANGLELERLKSLAEAIGRFAGDVQLYADQVAGGEDLDLVRLRRHQILTSAHAAVRLAELL
jgi:hypothetical protein